MAKKFQLNRTKQCKTCPWRKDADPFDIPNYDPGKHVALRKTISQRLEISNTIRAMACHCSTEGEEEYCVGWLVHQIGRGNNIPLRMQMIACTNAEDIEVYGEQHQRFEDTLPEDCKETVN